MLLLSKNSIFSTSLLMTDMAKHVLCCIKLFVKSQFLLLSYVVKVTITLANTVIRVQ